MGRRGNPYDNAKAESFMKTLKVEEVYLMAYETFEDVIRDVLLKQGVPYFRKAGVEHDVINPNDGEFSFIEVEIS
jgi:transposase InsO family protein